MQKWRIKQNCMKNNINDVNSVIVNNNKEVICNDSDDVETNVVMQRVM